MYNLFVCTLLTLFFQQSINKTSPDGKFTLIIETKDESDSQILYTTKLTDNSSKQTIELSTGLRHDLPAPNFYWTLDSRYLLVEDCGGSRIHILNLKTKKVEVELIGLIGNPDNVGQQFDSQNNILFYFSDPIHGKEHTLALWTFDLKTKKKEQKFVFNAYFDIEFPAINRTPGKRKITITYSETGAGQKIERIAY